MNDRHSPITIQQLIKKIISTIQELPSKEELSNSDWIVLLEAKFKLASLNLAPDKNKLAYDEYGLEMTQVFDDIETFFNELEGKNAEEKQDHLQQWLPTSEEAKDDLKILKQFCDRFHTEAKDEKTMVRGIIFNTGYAKSKLECALATLTCGVNLKIQKTDVQESKRDSSFTVSNSGILTAPFDTVRYKACVEKAKNFVAKRPSNILIEYKKVVDALEEGRIENTILELIQFSQCLEKDKIELEKWKDANETPLTQKAKDLINEIKNSPTFAYCNNMGNTFYLQQGLTAITLFQADELYKFPSFTKRLRNIVHETFNSNNRSDSTLAVIFSFPSKGKSIEKAIAIIFSPLLLIKNIVKVTAELIPAVIQEAANTLFNFTVNKIITPCLSYLTDANRKPLRRLAAGLGLIVGGALALASGIITIAAGVVNVTASLVLSPSHISREAEKAGFVFGKRILGLSDSGAEHVATAFYYTSKVLTVAAFIGIGFLTAGIAPAIAKLGTAGEWLVGAAKTVGSFFTGAFGFLKAAAVSAPIGVTVAAGSTLADGMQKSKLSMPQTKRLISSSPKGPEPMLSTTASLQQENNRLGLEPAPHQQPVMKSSEQVTPTVEPVVTQQQPSATIEKKEDVIAVRPANV